VALDRFREDQSREFLLSGFRQAGLSVQASLIEEAVRELDGIPGWLTFFGNSCLAGRCDIMEIKRRAVNVAIKELGNLIKGRPARYKHVLRAIAQGRRSWSDVKDYMEKKERSTISSSVLHNLIRNLEMMSIVKDYEFLDPIYEEASKALRA
jgi:AAA+ ATPase superfamily predicted ATPase